MSNGRSVRGPEYCEWYVRFANWLVVLSGEYHNEYSFAGLRRGRGCLFWILTIVKVFLGDFLVRITACYAE